MPVIVGLLNNGFITMPYHIRLKTKKKRFGLIAFAT